MSAEPMPDRCGAKLGKRPGYCEAWPVNGAKRCRVHGGTTKPRHGEKNGRYAHGKRAKGYAGTFQRMTADVRAAVEASLADPNLLDPRRPVALAHALASEAYWPTEERALEFARSMNPTAEPTAAQVQAVHAELMRQAAAAVDLLGKRQEAAARQVRSQELLRAGVLPLVTEFTLRVMEIAKSYVAAEKIPDLREDLRRAVHVLAAQVERLE